MADQTIWQRFASLLGIEERHAEDALHSGRVARHVVSRRSFLGASAALAGAAVFAFPTPAQDELRQLPIRRGSTISSFDRMLKERYTDEGVRALTSRDDPYLRGLRSDSLAFRQGDAQNFEVGASYQIGFGDAKKPAEQLVVSAIDQKRGIITFSDNFWAASEVH